MDIKKISVMESVYGRNEKISFGFNKILTDRKIFCVNVMGPPGAGKTTVLLWLAEKLNAPVFVIEGDIASDIDKRKLDERNIPAAQINTGGACHLDADIVRDVFEKHGREFGGGYLFIENIGNLVCPAEFMIGEHKKLLVASAADGSDKPYKYPLAFEKADAILLNKCDLRGYVDFDPVYFMDGVRKLNETAPVFEITAKNGTGLSEVINWVINTAKPVIG